MSKPFVNPRLLISIFCGLIFLLEIMAPLEYVFGHLYIIPILLVACELTSSHASTSSILSATSIVTRRCVLLTSIDLVLSAMIYRGLSSIMDFPLPILVNRLNVVIVLFVTNWLIQSSLKYMDRIFLQKEEINYQRTKLAAQIQIDKIHEDFVHMLTHDLKTPLLGAIQTINLFRKGIFGSVNANQVQVLDIMDRSQQRSLELVQTLLNVYRNDNENLILDRQPIDLELIAKESIDIVLGLGIEHQIKFNLKYYKISNQHPAITGDRLQLSRVFTNLLTNALYHSPRGGQIHVIIYDRDHRCVVEILDRGQGILPADLPFLFDRFYQAQKKLKGFGLGLHLSRQIIEAHEGKIWAETRLPAGAKFCFSLPTEN
jgi:two-component system, NarL family, sensor kinase